jgi:hypothetical protein
MYLLAIVAALALLALVRTERMSCFPGYVVRDGVCVRVDADASAAAASAGADD